MNYDTILEQVAKDAHGLHESLVNVTFVAAVGYLAYEAYKVFQGSTGTVLSSVLRVGIAVLLLGNLGQWTSWLTDAANSVVEECGGGGMSSDSLMKQYKEVLKDPSVLDQTKKEHQGDLIGWWMAISDPKSAVGESVMQVCLWLLGNMAFVLAWMMGLIQRFLMLMSIAASPIFIGLWMLPGTRSNGLRYMIGVGGLAIWPLGWAFGNLVTKAILQFGANAQADWMDSVEVIFVVGGLWLIVNALFWPIVISMAIVSGGGHGGNWMMQSMSVPMMAVSAGTSIGAAAATGGASAGASAAASGGAAVASSSASLASRPTQSPEV
jgi:hypothetical protein